MLRVVQFVVAINKLHVIFSQLYQVPEIIEWRITVGILRFLIYKHMVGIYPYPGLTICEAGAGSSVPLKRRAAVVPRTELLIFYELLHIFFLRLQVMIHVQGFNIAVILNGVEFNVSHAQLITIIKNRGGA